MTITNVSKETLATGGVLGAAFLAASCCLAPALFILFGISAGTLTQLSALEPYRPCFVAVGVVCLAAAAWWIYGGRERASAPCTDERCAVDSPRQRRTRRLFWISVAVFVTAVSYPYALSLYLNLGGS